MSGDVGGMYVLLCVGCFVGAGWAGEFKLANNADGSDASGVFSLFIVWLQGAMDGDGRR